MKRDGALIEDWLIRRVVARGFSPVFVWLLATFIPTFYFGVLAYLTGNLWGNNEIRGFLEDYNSMSSLFIGIPLVVTFYFLANKFISECMHGLRKNQVFGRSLDERYNNFYEFLSAMKQDLSSSKWMLVGVIPPGAFVFIAGNIHHRSRSWLAHNQVAFVSMEVLWFISFWFAAVFVLRSIWAVVWINRAFQKFRIRVQPMHPDKSGGLAPLGQFSVRLGYAISAIGFIIAINQATTHYIYTGKPEAQNTLILALGWVLYFLVSPLAFFAPIGAAHDAMLRAKREELMFFAKQFEKEYRRLKKLIAGGSFNEVDTTIEDLEKVEYLYGIVNGFPVWPFQIQKIAQFSASVVLPFVLTVLSTVVVNIVSRWIH